MEFKYNDAPRLTKSMSYVVEYLDPSLWVVYPGNELYPLTEKVTVLPVLLKHGYPFVTSADS